MLLTRFFSRTPVEEPAPTPAKATLAPAERKFSVTAETFAMEALLADPGRAIQAFVKDPALVDCVPHLPRFAKRLAEQGYGRGLRQLSRLPGITPEQRDVLTRFL